MKPPSLTLFSSSALAVYAALLFAPHAMADNKDKLNTADVKFVKHESTAGTADVKIAALGVEKAERADVKAFAETLVTHRTQSNTEVRALAEKKGVEVSTMISPKRAEEFLNLEKASKANFDKEFLAAVVRDHQNLVSSFEESAKDATDDDVRKWSEKMLPTIKANLAKAPELAAK